MSLTTQLLNLALNGGGGLLNELMNPQRDTAEGRWTREAPGP